METLGLTTHAARAAEYVIAAGSLVLFLLFWRYVTGSSVPRRRSPHWGGVVFAVFAAGALLLLAAATVRGAAPLRLPADRAWDQGADSPGPVTFRHASHVDAERPDCTACHPRLFPIVPVRSRQAVTHAHMDARRQCGACHDGTRAFSREDCASCHGDR